MTPPVCTTCNDTHVMTLGEGTALCTRCPTPCEACRSRGPGRAGGPYCATTPCACPCHAFNHHANCAVVRAARRVDARCSCEQARAIARSNVTSLFLPTPLDVRVGDMLVGILWIRDFPPDHVLLVMDMPPGWTAMPGVQVHAAWHRVVTEPHPGYLWKIHTTHPDLLVGTIGRVR